MKYLAECDLIVEDLHSGDPNDVKLALEALRKHKFEEEKVLILISSLMAWQGTPNKVEEIKTKEVLEAERRAAEAEAQRRAMLEAGGEQMEGEEPEKPEAMDDYGDEQEEGQQMEGEISEISSFKELPPKEKIRRKFIH